MSQTDLPGAGRSLVLSAPPETDTSVEAVGYPPSADPNGQNQGIAIMPEMTVGSPKKEAKIEAEKLNSPITRNQKAAVKNVSPLKDYQPQRQLNPTLVNQTSVVNLGVKEDKHQYWKTEIVPPITTQEIIETKPHNLIPTPSSPPLAPKPMPTTKTPSPIGLKVIKEVPKVGARGKIIDQVEIKPARVTVVSILFLLMAGFYGILAWISSLAVRWLNTSANGLTTDVIEALFIKNFPEYSLMPLAMAVASATFWWIGVELAGGSKKSAWKGLIAGLFWPLLIFGLNQWVGVILTRFLNNPQLLTNLINSSGFDLRAITPIYSAQIALIIGAGMLLMSWGGFRYPAENKVGSKSQMIKWIGWGLMLPVFIYLGLVNWVALDKDMNYEATVKEAGFHVYKMKNTNENWQQITQFKVNQSPSSLLIGRDDFVETGFDIPLTDRVRGRASLMVVVRQIDVAGGFDINSFAHDLIEGADVREVEVKRSVNGKGLWVEKRENTGKMTVLALTTSDNVLLLLSSKGAGINDLINLADGLN